MVTTVNQEVINDTAKLMMHRLIARALVRRPSLVARAKESNARMAERYPDRDFIREWNDLLRLPREQLRRRLTSRDPEMYRLRLSSPFVIAEGIDFTDQNFRRRLRRAAKRIVERSLERSSTDPTMAA